MITSLAYLGITSPNKDEWPEMATKFWGAMLTDPGPDGSVRLKFDGREGGTQGAPSPPCRTSGGGVRRCMHRSRRRRG